MTKEVEFDALSILDSLDYAYFEADLSGVLTAVNDAFCKSVGYTRDEILGGDYRKFTYPKQVRKIYHVFNTVFQTGQPQKGVEFTLRRRDGTTSFVEGAVSL